MPSAVDLVNMALDAIGGQATINSINPPGPPNSLAAQVASRNYQQQVTDIFRAANWSTGRYQTPLTLLRAAYGTPENTTSTTNVPPIPWLYEYAYPSDCMRMRFVLPNVTQLAGAPVPMTGIAANQFPVTSSSCPFIPGIDKDANGNQVRVILTNVENAVGIYTQLVQDPNLWDSMLQSAVIAALAAYFVNPLNRNAALLNERVQIAVAILKEARTANANEAIANQDHEPDFMRIRATGGGFWGALSSGFGVGLPYGASGYGSYDSWNGPDGVSY